MTKKNTYNLTEFDLAIQQEKLNKQRDYLVKNEFITSNGQVKSLLDVSFSANHSPRYYSQLLNRINTIDNYSQSYGLSPIFLTITIDGFFRDLLKANYTRLNKKTDRELKVILKSVPNDKERGFIRDKIKNKEQLTVKDLYNILNHQWRQFSNHTAFKEVKSRDKRVSYIKTVEPHKDGVPHFHALLFIPNDLIDLFKEDYKKIFIAPQNSRPKLDKNKKYIKNTMRGFETDVKQASAYILKYITKSFLDVKKENKLDYLTAWYIKHKISRCVTSRTLLPQWIYQKCFIFEEDWYILTDALTSSDESSWSKDKNYFKIHSAWDNVTIEYISGELSLYSSLTGRLKKRIGERNYKPKKKENQQKTPNKWIKKELKPSPVYKDNMLIGYFHKNEIKLIKENHNVPHKSDLELYNYYHSLDIETCNLQHYGYVKNTLINRGILTDKKVNLNDYIDIEKQSFKS